MHKSKFKNERVYFRNKEMKELMSQTMILNVEVLDVTKTETDYTTVKPFNLEFIK